MLIVLDSIYIDFEIIRQNNKDGVDMLFLF